MLSNGVLKADVLDHNHDELKILLVEDSESDAYAVRRFLEAYMKLPHSVVRVTTLEQAEQAVSSRDTHFDIVLLDLGLPDSTGNWETYSRMSVYKEKLPIIVLTSVDDDDLAIKMLGLGAQDYVKKDNVYRDPGNLCRNIHFSIQRHRSFSESKKEMSVLIAEQTELLELMNGSYSVMPDHH